MAMNLFDEIIQVLKDGEWHSVKEILSKIYKKPAVCLRCINFLDHFEFLQFDKAEDKVRIIPALKSFLEEIEKLE